MWGIGRLSLLFVPPTERRRNGDFYAKYKTEFSKELTLALLNELERKAKYEKKLQGHN